MARGLPSRARGAPMNCPNCGLINPPTAQRCDCGYDFVDRRQKQPLLPPSRSHKLSGWAKVGIVSLVFGLMLLSPRFVSQTDHFPAERSIGNVLGYLLGRLVGGLLGSAVIALPIIWLIEQVRKWRFRARPR